jgi:phytanoyl-CoA hydroxylase
MISNDQRQQFRQDGFLLLKNALDHKVLNNIYRRARQLFATQIERVLGETVDIDDRDAYEEALFRLFEQDFTTYANTGKTMQHSVLLHQLGVSDVVLDLLKGLGLSDPVIAVRPGMQLNSRFLSKDGNTYWKLDAHQDWRTGQGSLDSVVVWLPLVPAGYDLGALQVIPGSHLGGLRPAEAAGYEGFISENIDDSEFMQTEFEVGDILIFSKFLVHRSGKNSTRNIRWSIQLRYNNLAEPTFIERGYPSPYIYKPQDSLITPDFPTQSQLQAVFQPLVVAETQS